jgi:NAD(P)-dependent dehydrogenase (short-subunit alcohol dehydrogenase family)
MTVDSSVAVVAGVGPGLSAAVCRRLAVEGYSVVGIARSAGFGSGLAADIEAAGGRFTLYQADVTDPAGIAAAFARIEGELGRISVLIYTAGVFAMRPITDTTPEEFQRLWSVNCFGGFVCAREAASRMLAHREEDCLSPKAIAETYLHLIRQDRSAWTFELDLRPDRELF